MNRRKFLGGAAVVAAAAVCAPLPALGSLSPLPVLPAHRPMLALVLEAFHTDDMRKPFDLQHHPHVLECQWAWRDDGDARFPEVRLTEVRWRDDVGYHRIKETGTRYRTLDYRGIPHHDT